MSIKKKFFEFTLWLTVLTLFLLVVYQMVYIIWPALPVASFILYIFLVPYVLNLLVYVLILKSMTLEPQYFVQIIILSIVVKLVLYGAFCFVIIYFNPEEAMANVVSFFVIYLFSTALEVSMLVPLIKGNQKTDKNESQTS